MQKILQDTRQKAAPFDRKTASYFLMCDTGIRPDFDYAKLAVDKYNIIMKKGAWFTFCDPVTGEILEEDGKPVKQNGMIKVYDYLKANPAYYEKLVKYIDNDLSGSEQDINEVAPEDVDYPFTNDPDDKELENG